jgi:myosin heavy subunit
MALSDDILKVKKQLESLKKSLDDTSKKQIDAIVDSFVKGGNSLKEWKEQLESFRDIADQTSNSLNFISQSFTDSVNELQKQNKYLSNSRTITNQLVKSAQEALSVRKGETSINEKSLKAAKEQLQQQKSILQNAKRNLKDKKAEFKEIQNILNNIDEYEKGLDGVLQTNKEINRELGIAPKILAGLDKALQKAGLPAMGIANALEETMKAGQKAARSGENIGKEFKPLSFFTKQVGNNLKESLTPANLLQGTITALVIAFGASQKSISELAKGLGMSASSATQMRQEFASIANSSMNANISVKGLQESQLAVGQALGTNAMLNEKDLKTMTDIVKKTGLQHDELVGIEKLSLATGKSLDNNVKSALGGATAYASQNKLAINNNKILKEVNKASSSLKLSLGGSVEALGKAVVQAQKFGVTLDQANSLASSLLDFESSIENELSAELLTGKNLNLERARQLSLEGNIAEAAEEVLKQLKGSKEFSEMNVIQQEAMAKAVGLTRDELASSLIEREALAKMSAAEGESASQAYERLKASGKTESEIVKLLGEKTVQQLEQQSAQDKFNASVEKLREIFVQVMDSLAPIFDVLSSIASVVIPAINLAFEPIRFIVNTISDGLSYIHNLIKESTTATIAFGSAFALLLGYQQRSFLIEQGSLALKKTKSLFQTKEIAQEGLLSTIKSKGLFKTIADAAMTAFRSAAAVPVVGPVLGAAAAASAVALGMKYMQDGVIGPGGEMVVSGPKGSIQLDKDDSIVAGTNLFDKNKSQSSSPQSTTVVDMTKTNTLLQQLIDLISAGGDVVLDGQKVGVALNLVSYKTQ